MALRLTIVHGTGDESPRTQARSAPMPYQPQLDLPLDWDPATMLVVGVGGGGQCSRS